MTPGQQRVIDKLALSVDIWKMYVAADEADSETGRYFKEASDACLAAIAILKDVWKE